MRVSVDDCNFKYGSYIASFLSYSAISVQRHNFVTSPYKKTRRQNFSTSYSMEKQEWWNGLPGGSKSFTIGLATLYTPDSVAGVLEWLSTELLSSPTVCYSLLKCFTTSQKISLNKFISIRVFPQTKSCRRHTGVGVSGLRGGPGVDAVVGRGPRDRPGLNFSFFLNSLTSTCSCVLSIVVLQL